MILRWGTLSLVITALLCPSSEAIAPFVPKSFLSPKSSDKEKVNNQSARNACALQIARAERSNGIPKNLMQAIAKVESGKTISTGEYVAWPWTINSGKKSYFCMTKAEAIKKAKALQNKGIKSIDVGCMQVNLRHHPDAFENLEAAFDPHQNVSYAANHLKSQYKRHNNWNKAVSHYHSSKAAHHVPYHAKVMAMWDSWDGPTNTRKGEAIRMASIGKRITPGSVKPKPFQVLPSKSGSVLVASSRPVIRRVGRNGKFNTSSVHIHASPLKKTSKLETAQHVVSKKKSNPF